MPRTSAGPTAPSAVAGPSGSVSEIRPPERSAQEAWLSASSTSSASQPLGCNRVMTSSAPVSTSRTPTEARSPVRPSSTGAKPMARAHRTRGERAPDSSMMTALRRPSSLTRTMAATAPSAAHAAIGSPARGRPSERAQSRASSASAPSVSTSLARIQSGRSERVRVSAGRRAAIARRSGARTRSGSDGRTVSLPVARVVLLGPRRDRGAGAG